MEIVSVINNYIQSYKWKTCFEALVLISPSLTSPNLEEKLYDWLHVIAENFSDVENLNNDLVKLLDLLLAICMNDLKKSPPKAHITKLFQHLAKHHEDLIEISNAILPMIKGKDTDKLRIVLKTYTICMERGHGCDPQTLKQYGPGLEAAILKCSDYKDESLLQAAARCLTALNCALARTCSSNKGDDGTAFCIDRVLGEINQTLLVLNSVYDEGGINLKSQLNPLSYNVQNSSLHNFTLFQTRLQNLVFLLTNLLSVRNDWLIVPLASIFDTLTTTLSTLEGMRNGNGDKCKLEMLLERESAADDVIAPFVYQNMLAILDATLLGCGPSLLPFLNYMLTRMYSPIITFTTTPRPNPQRKLENLDKDSLYYTLIAQLTDSLSFSLLTSLNVLFRKMGAHIDLDKKLGKCLAKFIKSQMLPPTNRINLKLTEFDASAASRSQQSLTLINSIFLCLNTAYPYNKTLLQEILSSLLSNHNHFIKSCNSQIYLECLFAYTMTFPHESHELLCRILDCFRIHSSSPNINISAYAQESLTTLEAIIHPRFTVTPHLDLQSQSFLPRLDGEDSECDEQESGYHVNQSDDVDIQEVTQSSHMRIEQKSISEVEINIKLPIDSEENYCAESNTQNEASKRPTPALSNDLSKKPRFDHDKSTSSQVPISEDLRKILDSFHPHSSSSDSE